MNILDETLRDLGHALEGDLSGTQLAGIQDTIHSYAIAAAVAGAVSGIVPGIAGIAAMVTQTGLVWATYVKINKTLGISMQEHTAKFLGSAIATNLITHVGTLILAYAAAAIISFIPILGQAMAATADAAIGYIVIYACAIIYLKLITDMVRPNGTIEVPETDDTKHIIQGIIEKMHIEDVIKEGRDSYKKAKSEGKIDAAIKHRLCPNCHAQVADGQKFCSECGSALC